MSDNKRTDNRYNVTLPASIYDEISRKSGTVINISLNGIAIEAEDEDFKVNQEVSFESRDTYEYMGEIHTRTLSGSIIIKHIEKNGDQCIFGGVVKSAQYRDYVEEREIMEAINNFDRKKYEQKKYEQKK